MPVSGARCLRRIGILDLLAGVSFLYILLAGLGNEDRSIGRVEVQMNLLYPFLQEPSRARLHKFLSSGLSGFRST